MGKAILRGCGAADTETTTQRATRARRDKLNLVMVAWDCTISATKKVQFVSPFLSVAPLDSLSLASVASDCAIIKLLAPLALDTLKID